MGKTEGKYYRKKTRRSIVLSVIGIILCVIFAAAFLCNMVIILKASLHPERPPTIFGITPLVVLSGSMSGNAEDHIEVGDLIFVDRTDTDALAVGDVISFQSKGAIITHRITEIKTNEAGARQFTTKGDANNAEDKAAVEADAVVGVFKARIPKLGNFVIFVQSPAGMLLFIGLPVAAFLIYDLIRRQKYANAEKAKDEELQRLRRMTDQVRGAAPIPADDRNQEKSSEI